MPAPIRELFLNFNLSITFENNIDSVNFIDVCLDLKTGLFYPYHKPNENLHYVNCNSNHPYAVIKSVVKVISHRISKLSANNQIFNDNAEYYNKALARAGYVEKIQFNNNNQSNTINNSSNSSSNDMVNNNQHPKKIICKYNKIKKYRKRKLIWYNPPYSKHSNINIPKIVFYALDKCFQVGHTYNTIFNRHTIKLSFSTVPKLANILPD